jgi:hypothetical protein
MEDFLPGIRGKDAAAKARIDGDFALEVRVLENSFGHCVGI